MIGKVRLRVTPEEFNNQETMKERLEAACGETLNDWRIVRKSIDARQRKIMWDVDYEIATAEDKYLSTRIDLPDLQSVSAKSPTVVIVGAGPAGLFAALRALELGIKPIIIERGKPVEKRLHDIVNLQKNGELNPESNYCFGEGGAGAFSDGKLFTRSKKRGNVKEVLGLLNRYGAKEDVLYETHPHIGSDKLPKVIRNIREAIIDHGGEIHFSKKFSRLIIECGEVKGIETADGERFYGPVVLATGHSAHDVYETLHEQGVRLEQKGFAMGARLEHPQHLIDRMVYHNEKGRGHLLPPAEYSVSCQIDGRGVYSFCMCPGGVIVPAMSASGESVVNGMSASGRSGRLANSGLVVEIRPEDLPDYSGRGPLGLMEFQRDVEKKFYDESESINAPAQRMKDFTEGRISKSLPATSYVPGIHSSDLIKLFPEHVGSRLKKGLKYLGKKHRGFLTNEAVLIGLESRTSSPVRVPRNPDTLEHPEIKGLYPCGEGAGYAGGIVSAAIDGRRALEAINIKFENNDIKY